jgi:ubiquinone biosynthesis protein
VIALGRDDIARIVENIEKLQGSPIDDRSSLEKDLASFIADFGGQAVMEIDLNDALEKGRKLAFKHNLKLNPDLFLLFRTISLLEGIGISLDPEFRSLDVIKPYAFKLLRKQLDPRNLLKNRRTTKWMLMKISKFCSWEKNENLHIRFLMQKQKSYQSIISHY